MARVIAFLFALVLCSSVALGSVAHAAEGPRPLESVCTVESDHASDPGDSDADKLISHSHGCHGHHIGVPHMGVAALSTADLSRVMSVVPERALSSLRARTPIRPPQA